MKSLDGMKLFEALVMIRRSTSAVPSNQPFHFDALTPPLLFLLSMNNILYDLP